MAKRGQDQALRAGIVAVALVGGLADCSSAIRYAPATPFYTSSENDRLTRSPKLSALLAQFVRQETPTSCSVAATATILRAALALEGRPPVSQAEVVQSEVSGRWERATHGPDSPGVSLDDLALFVVQAFYRQGLKHVAADVMHVKDQSADTVNTLLSGLEKNEKNAKTYFIIINFLQSVYFADGDPVGHMSVIGAYDAERERVLVLDVDYIKLQPYWVPLSVLVAGMNTSDDETGEHRGYLIIRL